MTDGADWLLAALATEGVPVLFGNPGSTELPITDALGRQSAVRYVLALHEAAAIGMADGWAQATGGLAAANVHVQPGLANAMSGILNAARCRVPVLVTVGQQVQELLPQEPFLGGELVAMAAPVAKGAWEVTDPEDLAEGFALAVRTALEHPRGPVVLSIPLDVQVAPAPAPHARVAPAAPPAPDAGALDAAAALLGAARAPAIVAGDAVTHAAAGEALAALAERLGAPILGEPLPATVPLPTGHPLWRGPLPAFAADIRPVLEPFDVVLAVGMPVFRLFGHSEGPALPPGTALRAPGGRPARGRQGARPRSRPRGRHRPPASRACSGAWGRRPGRRPNAARPPRPRPPRPGRPRGRGSRGRRPAPACRPPRSPAPWPPRSAPTTSWLTRSSPRGAACARSSGPRRPGTWLAHRGSALGWGLPAAVGAALADPGRRVMALQGDGSLLFGVSALWTAAHEGIGLALVVADNAGYEILRAGLEGMTGRAEGDWPGLRLDGPLLDLAAICRGFGASAARVDDPDALPAALDDLWTRAQGGPAVLVVGVEGRTAPVGYPLTGGIPGGGSTP